MSKWILSACFLLGLCSLSGCIYEEVASPAIVPDYNPLNFNDVNASSPKPTQSADLVTMGVPPEWIPPAYRERKWTAIVLHHSATAKGNAAFFNKAHEGRSDDNGNHWKGIGYDFVIGNGTITGAHCRTDNTNWANKTAIGICLVGDFDKTSPTRNQIASLLKLIQFLQERYHIPKSRIYGHGQTPGTGPTACPGRRFPIEWIKSQLDF
jgi:hypothetical protein